jgi:LysM repeat protein
MSDQTIEIFKSAKPVKEIHDSLDPYRHDHNTSSKSNHERSSKELEEHELLPHCTISDTATISKNQTATPHEHASEIKSVAIISYKVVSGDCLWSIAKDVLSSSEKQVPTDSQIAMEVQKIAQSSNISNPDLIQVGEVISIPNIKGSTSNTDFRSVDSINSPPQDNASMLPAAKTPIQLTGATTNTDSKGSSITDPNGYFMTQFYDPKWNPNGPSASLNCGPTSLAMALKHFGKTLNEADSQNAEHLIESTRIAMTGSNDNTITTYDQIQHGAQICGLTAGAVNGLEGVRGALDQGKMVIAGGNPESIGAYGNNLSSSDYSHYNGDHVILIVGRKGASYIINDPLSRIGSITVSQSEIQSFLATFGTTNGGIAVGS